MEKIRILYSGETTGALSGFGKYGREVLSRLSQNDKFHIAELASAGSIEDGKFGHINGRWRYYPNHVNPGHPLFEHYNSNGLNAFGMWRFERCCLDFKPHHVFSIRDPWNSLVRNTNIITINNIKKIQDIQLDDLVLTHKGNYKKVYKLFKKQYTGKIFKIIASHCKIPVEITGEHPILICKRNTKNSNIAPLLKSSNLIWEKTKNIKESDLLVYPIDKFGTNKLDKDFCRLLGYYTAEGNLLYKGLKINNQIKGIQFTFNIKEKEYINDVITILVANSTYIPKIRNEGNRTRIRIYDPKLSLSVLKYCGNLAGGKRFHPSLLELDFTCTKHLLCGLFRGDGGVSSKKRNLYTYCTKSEQLAYQIFKLCLRFGILPYFNYSKNNIKEKIYYRYLFGFANKSSNGFNNIRELKNEPIQPADRIKNGYAWLTIKQIEISEQNTEVYNLAVEEDESYVTSFAVHNCSHVARSPFRRFFHFSWMPTVDSAPQQIEWIEQFKDCDSIFTYSDWAIPVLKEQSGGSIKPICSAYPGVDLNVFKPLDKTKLREYYGIPKDAYVIGMVCRNQRRKLLPELFKMFRIFLDKYGKTDIGKKTYLYLHTSYPEAPNVGWDLPALLTEFGIGNRVYFTYYCRESKKPFCSKFEGANTFSTFTQKPTAFPPNVGSGLDEHQLAEIHNLFDVYVQYANCLGKHEEVLTSLGWKKISDIKVGESVWTHKHRWRKVTNTWYNLDISKDEPFCDIKVCGDYENVLATANHKFYSLTKEDIDYDGILSVREKVGKNLSSNKELPEPTPKELKTLKVGDILAYPINDEVSDTEFLSFSDNTQVKLDEEFCEFLGLFMADGTAVNSTSSYIGLISHEDEKYNQELAIKCFERLGYKPKIYNYPKRHAVDIRIHSKLLVADFKELFYKNGEKCFPSWAELLPLEKQRKILKGLFLGDGYYMEKRNVSTFSNVSKLLIDQIKFIFRRLRISYNLNLSDRLKDNLLDGKNRKPIYTYEIFGNIKDNNFSENLRNSTKNFYYKNWHYLQIKSITKNTIYNEGRYNLEVEEDHSMTLRHTVTPQCEGSGMPQLEAAACGIPVAAVNYSAMADVVEKTQGIALKPASIPRDIDLGADRAVPDNNFAADAIYKHLCLDKSYRAKKSKQARQAAETYFNWDRTAKIWSDHFERVELSGLQGRWDAPIQLHDDNIPELPQNLSNAQLIQWCSGFVAKNPELSTKYFGLDWLNKLNMGFDRNIVYEQFKAIGLNKINWEKARCGMIQLNPNEDWIRFAHLIEKGNK